MPLADDWISYQTKTGEERKAEGRDLRMSNDTTRKAIAATISSKNTMTGIATRRRQAANAPETNVSIPPPSGRLRK